MSAVGEESSTQRDWHTSEEGHERPLFQDTSQKLLIGEPISDNSDEEGIGTFKPRQFALPEEVSNHCDCVPDDQIPRLFKGYRAP